MTTTSYLNCALTFLNFFNAGEVEKLRSEISIMVNFKDLWLYAMALFLLVCHFVFLLLCCYLLIKLCYLYLDERSIKIHHCSLSYFDLIIVSVNFLLALASSENDRLLLLLEYHLGVECFSSAWLILVLLESFTVKWNPNSYKTPHPLRLASLVVQNSVNP